MQTTNATRRFLQGSHPGLLHKVVSGILVTDEAASQ